MKHTHCDLIKAWADGAEIQYRDEDDHSMWHSVSNPGWGAHVTYRVKPPTLRFRTALFLTNAGVYWIGAHQEGNEFNHKAFVRWVSAWQEVEL